MSTRSAWQLVARREVGVKLTDRTFVLSTVATLLLIAGVLALQAFLDGRTSTYEVTTTGGPAAQMAQRIAERAAELDDGVRVEREARRPTTRRPARPSTTRRPMPGCARPATAGPWSRGTRRPPSSARSSTRSCRRRCSPPTRQRAGTSVDALTAGSTVDRDQLNGDATRSQLNDVLAFAFSFLFYLASFMFGMTLAYSVIEEKQSRIVEMIAAAIPLRQLLAGKIVGNTALAMGQMALFVAVGLVGMSFTEFGTFVPSIAGPVLWFLGFFLAGFVALSCLWAVAGALASPHRGPAVHLRPGHHRHDAHVLRGAVRRGVACRRCCPSCRRCPRSSCRSGSSTVGSRGGSRSLALVLLLAFAGALVLLSERLYRRALLQTGGKVGVLQAWRTPE